MDAGTDRRYLLAALGAVGASGCLRLQRGGGTATEASGLSTASATEAAPIDTATGPDTPTGTPEATSPTVAYLYTERPAEEGPSGRGRGNRPTDADPTVLDSEYFLGVRRRTTHYLDTIDVP